MRKFYLFGLPLLAAALVACDPGTTVRGFVRDTAGSALPDATVTLSIKDFSQRSVTTAADGSYSIGMLHPPNVEETFTVVKPGYLGFRKHFFWRDQPHQLDVVLLPDPASSPQR